MTAPGWYVLIHQLPTKPIYLRAKIGQRLARAGVLALKNSVYVLPRHAGRLEDLASIVEEAKAAGGEAFVCEGVFVEGVTSETLARRFRAEREADFEAFAAEVREARAALDRRDGLRPPESELLARLARFKHRLSEIEAIDFFGAPGRKKSKALLASLERRLRADPTGLGKDGPRDPAAKLKGRAWATRRGLHIDRLACAWLIRRFIDPNARFRFIDPGEDPRPGELRFDMVGGDFTHEGDSCTFEVLVRLLRSPDPALRHVAEIVHDVDLKDGKFDRPEAAGVQQIVLGIVLDCSADEDRLKRGFGLFDDLLASFRKRVPMAKAGSK